MPGRNQRNLSVHVIAIWQQSPVENAGQCVGTDDECKALAMGWRQPLLAGIGNLECLLRLKAPVGVCTDHALHQAALGVFRRGETEDVASYGKNAGDDGYAFEEDVGFVPQTCFAYEVGTEFLSGLIIDERDDESGRRHLLRNFNGEG